MLSKNSITTTEIVILTSSSLFQVIKDHFNEDKTVIPLLSENQQSLLSCGGNQIFTVCWFQWWDLLFFNKLDRKMDRKPPNHTSVDVYWLLTFTVMAVLFVCDLFMSDLANRRLMQRWQCLFSKRCNRTQKSLRAELRMWEILFLNASIGPKRLSYMKFYQVYQS